MRSTLAAVSAAVLLASVSMHGQKDWVYYGQDQGATRYSTLAQITTSNVSSLKRAWTFHTGDKSGFFESTPLAIDGVDVLCRGERLLRARWGHRPAAVEGGRDAHDAPRRVVLAG